MKNQIHSKLLRLTIDQMQYLKLKAMRTFNISVQKYIVAMLFPKGWRRELQDMKESDYE